MAIIDQGWRVAYPITAFSAAMLREIMWGKLNVGAGPLDIGTDTPPPWEIVDPRVSLQSIIMPMAGNLEAAKMLARGYWIELTPTSFILHLVDPTMTAPVVISVAIIG